MYATNMVVPLVQKQTHITSAISILVACELYTDWEGNTHGLNVLATLNRYVVTVLSQHFSTTRMGKHKISIQAF
jgi:hypothetical protein